MMKIPQMIAAEVRRLFSTKMGVLALVALLAVPILYGGLYLWANQDPYGNLDNVPVGLVVSDEGAEINGTERNLGAEVAEELIDDGTFDWHEVSADAANAGLDEGTYDFVVEIPANFTASIASITEDNPRAADLVLITNDANNYLASTIGTSAVSTIQRTVTEKVVAETGLAMLDALQEIRVNLVDATDGATQIVDGITTAQDGTVTLLDGSTLLADGTSSLVDGATQLADGTGALASGAASLADGTTQLADGAASLADGTSQLTTGAQQLADGTQQVADGAASLADGTSQLADGAASLADGTQQVADGAAALQTGTADLASGATDLATGAHQVADGTASFAQIAETIAAQASDVQESLPEIRADVESRLTELGLEQSQIDAALSALDEIGTALDAAGTQVQDAAAQVQALDDGAQQVAAGADALATGAATAADGASALSTGAAAAADGAATLSTGASSAATGADSLSTGAATAATGAATLATKMGDAAAGAATLSTGAASAASGATSVSEGAATLDTGANSLLTGATSLDDGADQLVTGLGTLQDGLVQLGDGAGELEDGLADGIQQIPESSAETRAAQAATLGSPVQTEQDSLTSAENYGAGLAPFFAALAAWIGIYALFLIVKPISRRAVTALHSPMRVTLAGWATPTLLGAVQVLGLFAVLRITLGFDFANPWGALGLLVLASATYTAIILALNVWLGSVGQFIGLVLMVLQLVTAGGTFPWQTLPVPLQALHHVLPMGYVVDAMRQIMYGGGGFDRIWGDLVVLLIWLVGAVLFAALGVARMTRSRTLRDLQPSLIG